LETHFLVLFGCDGDGDGVVMGYDCDGDGDGVVSYNEGGS